MESCAPVVNRCRRAQPGQRRHFTTALQLGSRFSLSTLGPRKLKIPFTKIFGLNLPCFHSLAVFLPLLGTPLHATFESGKELRSPQSSESTSCAGSVAFQVVLILLGGC
jgi:hypothetical protein